MKTTTTNLINKLCLNHVAVRNVSNILCEETPAQRSPADTFFQSLLHPKREITGLSLSHMPLEAEGFRASAVKWSRPPRVHCGPCAHQTACMVSRSGCWGSAAPRGLPSEQGSDWGSAPRLPSHPLEPLSLLVLSAAAAEKPTVRERGRSGEKGEREHGKEQ